MFHLLEVGVSTKIIQKSSAQEICLFFLNLSIKSFITVQTYGYLHLFWEIIQCNFILLLRFQLWPLGTLSWLMFSFDISTTLWGFLNQFLNFFTFSYHRMYQVPLTHLYIFCPNPRVSHFSKDFSFHLFKNLRNQNLDVQYSCCYRVPLFLGLQLTSTCHTIFFFDSL